MQFLADTVAIVRHFSNVGKIGKAAKLILQDADSGKNTILISIISIVEILYLSERNKIGFIHNSSLDQTYSKRTKTTPSPPIDGDGVVFVRFLFSLSLNFRPAVTFSPPTSKRADSSMIDGFTV